jgi:hypothetical protein
MFCVSGIAMFEVRVSRRGCLCLVMRFWREFSNFDAKMFSFDRNLDVNDSLAWFS